MRHLRHMISILARRPWFKPFTEIKFVEAYAKGVMNSGLAKMYS